MTNKKQTFFKFIIVIIILLSAYVILAKIFTFFPFEKDNALSRNTDSNSVNNSASNNPAGNSITDKTNQDNQTNNNPKAPVQNEGGDPNKLAEITGYVSNKNVDKQSQVLTIRVTINQFLNETGNCTLSLIGREGGFTNIVPTTNNPSSSTCQGFDIPLEKLSSGKWSIKIKVETSDKTGIIDGGEIEI